MCFASSIAESHKKLFIAPSTSSTHSSATATACAAAGEKQKKSKTQQVSTGGSIKMSRSKSRIQTEVCGDCGATDPSWASLNRGILLCSDCCSVHRSLGRHISIVKSLRQGNWEPSVLNFVNSLNAHGANSVWEHHLLDGTSHKESKSSQRLRKPTPKDALHPTKSDFIKAKHINLQFVLKPNFQDDDTPTGSNMEHELSKQLHASVRTSNLETSLRLLVQGADPNFFHEEKRSTPLHVAAKFGQASQIELLIVYGAFINAVDGNGLTPLEVAKANNHNLIAERLLDAQYEVTDRIIMYLGGKKPDHASGRHMPIPDENGSDISEQLKIARGRLQLVPNKMFEELVMDLYDEVDRRENESIWATSTINVDSGVVPFLPANPFLSATRNQGRQKLARFSKNEFAGLLTDVLIDARRRQNMANLRPLDTSTSSGVYNSNSASNSFNTSNEQHTSHISDEEPIYDPVASDDDYEPMPEMAAQPYQEVATLRKQLNECKSEISQLRTVVQKLSSENSELKSKYSYAASNNSVYDEPLRIDLNCHDNDSNQPMSLPADVGIMAESLPSGVAAGVGSASTSTSSSATNSNQSTIKRPASMYERRLATNFAKTSIDNRSTASMYQMAGERSFTDDVKQLTELVTRRLKELILAMNGDAANKESLVPCAERIRLAVTDLISIYSTPTNCSDTIRETLKELMRYNILLQHECENLHKAYDSDNKLIVDQYIKEVRDCAYHIASATKTLLVQFD